MHGGLIGPVAEHPRIERAFRLACKASPFLAMVAVLFVTAHPDDESMFFAPTAIDLVQRGLQAALLCLSTGSCRKFASAAARAAVGLAEQTRGSLFTRCTS